MTSTPRGTRIRKAPAERRAEILDTAARLALEHGLERVTMQQVAGELGVRPGLISHYFPAVDGLLCEAFARAVSRERAALLPDAERELPPLRRLARFLDRIGDDGFANLGRLWLNARHLARYRPTLRAVVAEQEAEMRGVLTALIEDGVRTGDFVTEDPLAACVVILVTIDGLDSYANADEAAPHPVLDTLVPRIAERELGLAYGSLRDER
ncbi:TetR/AcrR family transcriptional regulator [Streptomyces sp. NPDC101160]|uniref:TetR/AcrR family transcriptional regulator n=1 Tax=Streptomyces sp. NPDC101160 TaxID=3366118 RepID=UPI0038080C49